MIVAVPETTAPVAEAVIVAVPLATAVTRPVALTEATEASEDDHMNVTSPTATPAALAEAESCCVAPKLTSVAAPGVTTSVVD